MKFEYIERVILREQWARFDVIDPTIVEWDSLVEKFPILIPYKDRLDKEVIEIDRQIFAIAYENGGKYFFTSEVESKIIIPLKELVRLARKEKFESNLVLYDYFYRCYDQIISSKLATPITEVVVTLFNVPLDKRFGFTRTRSISTKIKNARKLNTLSELSQLTDFFDKYLRLVDFQFWGTEPNIILFSEKLNFKIRTKITEDFESIFELNNSPQVRWDRPPTRYLNFDLTFLYAVEYWRHYLKEEESFFEGLNTYLYKHSFNEELEYNRENTMADELKRLSMVIPDFEGKSKTGLWAFIREVDIQGLGAANDEARQRISQVAKNKLKGEARDAVSGTNSWPEMRRVLISLFASSKSQIQLNNELNSVTQRRLKVEDYYLLLRDIMIDLLIKSTEGLTLDQYNARETEVKADARLAFLNGLNSNIESHVRQSNPTSLEQAFQVARERAQFVGEESISALDFMQEMKNELLKTIDSKLSRSNNNQSYRQGMGKQGNDRAQEKYCSHHRTNNHNTQDCKFLKNLENGKYCSHHDSTSHSTSECKYLNRMKESGTHPSNMQTLAMRAQPNMSQSNLNQMNNPPMVPNMVSTSNQAINYSGFAPHFSHLNGQNINGPQMPMMPFQANPYQFNPFPTQNFRQDQTWGHPPRQGQ